MKLGIEKVNIHKLLCMQITLLTESVYKTNQYYFLSLDWTMQLQTACKYNIYLLDVE